jgi:ATP-dependent DNA helicase RecQ
VCLDPVHLVDGTAEAKWVIEAVKATGQRFGAAHVADVLAGKTNEKAEALRHTELPVFGIGKAHGRQHWQSMIRQMVGGGYLTIDVAGYGGLSLSPKAQALLSGEGSFRYREATAKPSKKVERARKLVAAVETEGVSEELLQRLKTLRGKIARERRVPAYVIFTDRTLIDMASKRPLTRWDFGEVNGVGESKLMQFAEIFLAEIRDYLQDASAAK